LWASRDPLDSNLAGKSKKLCCMIISLFYHKNREDQYTQNMRVRFTVSSLTLFT
jgi:hypothetical protein